jgi:hypothetical protein
MQEVVSFDGRSPRRIQVAGPWIRILSPGVVSRAAHAIKRRKTADIRRRRRKNIGGSVAVAAVEFFSRCGDVVAATLARL